MREKSRASKKRGATRTSGAASTRAGVAGSHRSRSRPAASTRTADSQVDNRIPVKLSAKRKKDLLDAIKPTYTAPAPPEDPSVVIARLRANEPKPAISKKPGGAMLDSTYSERRAAWEKAMKRETARKIALDSGASPEENQKLAAQSEHLVKHLAAGPQPTKRRNLPRRMRKE